MPVSAGVRLPFKIAGLAIPMVLDSSAYADAVAALAATVDAYYAAADIFPVVSCGETVDKLGYGRDVLRALEALGHELARELQEVAPSFVLVGGLFGREALLGLWGIVALDAGCLLATNLLLGGHHRVARARAMYAWDGEGPSMR